MGAGLGWSEILLIVLVALVIIKPEKIPETARNVGRAYSQFKKVMEDLTRTFDKEVKDLKKLERIPENTAKDFLEKATKNVKEKTEI